MFKTLITSLLTSMIFAQLPQTNQISNLIQGIQTVVQPNNFTSCSSCHITLCDNTIPLPNETPEGDPLICSDVNNMLKNIKSNLFKDSKDCEDKTINYICEVYVIPIEKITKKACTDNVFDDELVKEAYEQSFCEANKNCEDLSRCSWFNIDCDYDSDILPFLGELSTPFDESECPHTENNFTEKVKRFFEDYWKDMVISGVMDALLLSIIIIIMCCCWPNSETAPIQDRIIV